jgi:hypothetical protein
VGDSTSWAKSTSSSKKRRKVAALPAPWTPTSLAAIVAAVAERQGLERDEFRARLLA